MKPKKIEAQLEDYLTVQMIDYGSGANYPADISLLVEETSSETRIGTYLDVEQSRKLRKALKKAEKAAIKANLDG
jgi:hypothetical protein